MGDRWRDLLTLSRREQLGFISLFVIILILLAWFFVDLSRPNKAVGPELLAWADSVTYKKEKFKNEKNDTNFVFDPNTETVKNLQLLGFSNQAILNLIKYREAGGRINEREKLREIYGVDSALYARLEQSIQVNAHNENAFNRRVKAYANTPLPDTKGIHKEYETTSVDKTLEVYSFEINSADTAMFQLLRGVGPVLSRRIVAYRKKLGGYYSIDQLSEVYGLSGDVLEFNRKNLSVDDELLRPIDISSASLKQMKNHPYVDFYMAKEIYEARRSNQLNSLMQFAGSEAFKEADMLKLSKYLVVGK